MRRKESSLKEVLKLALPASARERVYSVALVEKRWAQVVGNELARRAKPEALSQGVLTVRVTDPVWGKMIHRLQGRIVPALNRAIGTNLVRRINFTKRSRLLHPPPVAPLPPAESEPLVPPARITEAAESIADPELRELVVRSAAHYLKAREQRRRK